MPIRTNAIGAELAPSTRTISTRETLAYAAGIEDTSERVFDDRRDDLIAPAPFCVSLEWPVVSHPEARAALGAAAAELRRGVHAFQDSQFHRPVEPGDQLTTDGTIVGLRATRAGVLVVTRLVTTDTRGRAVVTSWSGSMYRGVELEGVNETRQKSSGGSQPAVPPRPDSDLEVETAEIEVPLTMAHTYTECAQIWNPIHTERRVAMAAGLPDIILHGTATWALAGREIVHRYSSADWSRLERLHGRFSGMVRLGSTLEVRMEKHEPSGAVFFSVWNEKSECVISEGFASLAS